MIIDNILKIIIFLLPPLLLTIAVECTVVFALFRNWNYSYFVLLLNVLTNPLLNFIMLLYFSYIGMGGYYILLYALEVVVVITEGLIFAKLTDLKTWKALLVSLLLNGCSYGAGLLIF